MNEIKTQYWLCREWDYENDCPLSEFILEGSKEKVMEDERLYKGVIVKEVFLTVENRNGFIHTRRTSHPPTLEKLKIHNDTLCDIREGYYNIGDGIQQMIESLVSATEQNGEWKKELKLLLNLQKTFDKMETGKIL